ncbi:TonB-dependent receptor family protein [Candidatus Methylacidiphilum infernorum]|uniref:TonB-dependent receptor family protein n=1 Tax=Candidatus Methylacidiphilum infernorum TaxID=511746 RepID=UPI00031DEAC8|nr:TonB-dependent receptor [Candidatus Methylacidiphilum infernorum]
MTIQKKFASCQLCLSEKGRILPRIHFLQFLLVLLVLGESPAFPGGVPSTTQEISSPGKGSGQSGQDSSLKKPGSIQDPSEPSVAQDNQSVGSSAPSSDVPLDTTQIAEITVEATHETSLVVPSEAKAKEEMEEVPGPTNFIPASSYRKGRVQGMRDALLNQPGLYIQEAWGEPNDYRLSIRGTGLNSPTWTLPGILVLQDGLPWTMADGQMLAFSNIDPLAMQYVQVWRGADALRFGAVDRGGAINFTSYTGYTAPKALALFEIGSYGFWQGQLASGQVMGKADVYASLSDVAVEGFRAHSAMNDLRLNVNLGYRISPSVENRVYFAYVNQREKLTSTLTLDQMFANPTFCSPSFSLMDLRRYFDLVRVADRAAVQVDPDTTLILGAVWDNTQLWHPIFQFLHASYNDFALPIQLTGKSTLFGLPETHIIGILPQGLFAAETVYAMHFPSPAQGAFLGSSNFIATNVPLYMQESLELTKKLWLIAGMQLDYSLRSAETYNQVPLGPHGPQAFQNNSSSRDYYGINPKLGLLYQPIKEVQFYTNFTRVFEPPNFYELIPAASIIPRGQSMFPLQAETGTGIDVGTRGSWKRIQWDVAFYQYWMDDQILLYYPAAVIAQISNPSAISSPFVAFPFNGSPTVLQGVETGFTFILGERLLPQFLGDYKEPDRLVLNVNFMYSNFRFANDPVYDHNRLPLFPVNYLQAQLLYQHPSGFYIGPNVESSVTPYPVDYADTLYVPSWAILGFRLGYVSAHGWSVYFDARNITNEIYAATATPVTNAMLSGGPSAQAVFYPGLLQAFYGGFQWSW